MNKLAIPYQIKSNLTSYKEIGETDRTVKAVVNTYNYFDFDYDVLRPGAAAKSILERGAKSKADDKILHAMFHDLKLLAGKPTLEEEIEMDGKFVLYTETFFPETTLGEDTLINYKAGIYNQHSIGFRYMQIDYIEKEAAGWAAFLKDLINPEEAEAAGYGWDVKEIKWHEYSTVAFGANKLTSYLGTKSEKRALQYDSILLKMNTLIEKANKHDIKDKKLFDLQYKQLQQMIYELSISKPATKCTPKSRIKTADPVDEFNKLIKF